MVASTLLRNGNNIDNLGVIFAHRELTYAVTCGMRLRGPLYLSSCVTGFNNFQWKY